MSGQPARAEPATGTVPGVVAGVAPASEPASGTRAVAASNAAAESGEQPAGESRSRGGNAEQANEQEVRERIRELAARDREVRAHERAHLSAAGGLARGGMSLDTVRGPDGRQYAVGGEVQVDTSAVPGDPQATIAKARQIRRAALAPAEPSTQDRRVAAQAAAMETAARAELALQADETGDTAPSGASTVTAADAGTGEPCPMCGAGGHGRDEHVAGNQRRLDDALQGAPAGESLPAIDLQA